MQEEPGVSVFVILSAPLDHDLCLHHPPKKTPLNVLVFSQACDVVDKAQHKGQHSSSPRSNTLGNVSGDIVTFSNTAHPSIPPSSHRWSIHHTDSVFDLPFTLSLVGFRGGGGWDYRIWKETEVAHKLCWTPLCSSAHLFIGSSAFKLWAMLGTQLLFVQPCTNMPGVVSAS